MIERYQRKSAGSSPRSAIQPPSFERTGAFCDAAGKKRSVLWQISSEEKQERNPLQNMPETASSVWNSEWERKVLRQPIVAVRSWQ